MSSFSKFVLVALTVVSGVAASAHSTPDAGAFKAKPVIASHEDAPRLTPVVHHPHHRHHHVRHAHTARHVR